MRISETCFFSLSTYQFGLESQTRLQSVRKALDDSTSEIGICIKPKNDYAYALFLICMLLPIIESSMPTGMTRLHNVFVSRLNSTNHKV